jgi:hypothetical protein
MPHSSDSGPALPSGPVTFLFTDIEGSSRLAHEPSNALQPGFARRCGQSEYRNL